MVHMVIRIVVRAAFRSVLRSEDLMVDLMLDRWEIPAGAPLNHRDFANRASSFVRAVGQPMGLGWAWLDRPMPAGTTHHDAGSVAVYRSGVHAATAPLAVFM